MPAKRKRVREVAPAKRTRVIRRLDNDARRAQLLGLGRAAFAAHPYDEVSIDTLAARARLSKGLFYYYFPTKRDLYIAVVEATASDLVESLVAAVEAKSTPRDRSVAGVQAYLDHVEKHGLAFVALMRGGIGADPEIAKVLERVRGDILDKFLSGTPIGAFLQTRPLSRIAIRSWIGMVEAASIEWLSTSGVAKEAVRDMLVDLLFDLLSRVLGTKVSQTEYMTVSPPVATGGRRSRSAKA
ncbi:MAG: TetR/AcrR family transcriptional regulator [Kofleriaceae bacterium]|nr:TetR/AcrR family transcriptional regulator [Kofleriaceae bacterium]